jgi:hypothetical protein
MTDTGSIDLRISVVPTWDFALQGSHELIHGDATQLTGWVNPFHQQFRESQYDFAFVEPPGISDETSRLNCGEFFDTVAQNLEFVMKDNAVVVLLPRDQKGAKYLKSVIAASAFQNWGFEIFRKFTWKWTVADFHRASYCCHDIFVFRRGNMPTRPDSNWRYVDIVRYSRPESSDGMVQEIPQALVRDAFGLFFDPLGHMDTTYRVLDPFAGSATVYRALKHFENVETTSIELYRPRFEQLRDTLYAPSV